MPLILQRQHQEFFIFILILWGYNCIFSPLFTKHSIELMGAPYLGINIVLSMGYPKLYFSVLGVRECVSHLRYLHFCSVNTSLLYQLKTNASTWTRKNLEWLSWINVAYFISFDICWLCFSFVLIECYQVFRTPSACLTYRSHRLKFTPCLLCCADMHSVEPFIINFLLNQILSSFWLGSTRKARACGASRCWWASRKSMLSLSSLTFPYAVLENKFYKILRNDYM